VHFESGFGDRGFPYRAKTIGECPVCPRIPPSVPEFPRTQDVDNSITKALQPINDRLAKITAQLETMKPQAGNTLPQVMENNLAGQKDNGLGLKTVAALATQAREQNVQADPAQIAEAGKQLAASRQFFTTGKDDAWKAFVELLNYYSFLNSGYLGAQPLSPFIKTIDYDIGGTEGKNIHRRSLLHRRDGADQ